MDGSCANSETQGFPFERKLETLDGDINLHRSVHVPLILRDSLRIAKAIPRKEWPPPPHDTGHTQSD